MHAKNRHRRMSMRRCNHNMTRRNSSPLENQLLCFVDQIQWHHATVHNANRNLVLAIAQHKTLGMKRIRDTIQLPTRNTTIRPNRERFWINVLRIRASVKRSSPCAGNSIPTHPRCNRNECDTHKSRQNRPNFYPNNHSNDSHSDSTRVKLSVKKSCVKPDYDRNDRQFTSCRRPSKTHAHP